MSVHTKTLKGNNMDGKAGSLAKAMQQGDQPKQSCNSTLSSAMQQGSGYSGGNKSSKQTLGRTLKQSSK